MWEYEYKDYPKDHPLKKDKAEAGSGLIGCEMNERNGWSESFRKPKKTSGKLKAFFSFFIPFASKESR